MPSLLVTDREGAERAIADGNPSDIVALVSLHDPARAEIMSTSHKTPCAGFDAFSGSKIAFEFADTEPEDSWLGEFAATPEDIESVIAWGREHKDTEGTVLVHCNAGVGRSPAVAFILQCLWDDTKGRESHSLQRALSRCDTNPFPNAWVVKLGDDILCRDRGMVRAVKSFKDSVIGSRMY